MPQPDPIDLTTLSSDEESESSESKSLSRSNDYASKDVQDRSLSKTEGNSSYSLPTSHGRPSATTVPEDIEMEDAGNNDQDIRSPRFQSKLCHRCVRFTADIAKDNLKPWPLWVKDEIKDYMIRENFLEHHSDVSQRFADHQLERLYDTLSRLADPQTPAEKAMWQDASAKRIILARLRDQIDHLRQVLYRSGVVMYVHGSRYRYIVKERAQNSRVAGLVGPVTKWVELLDELDNYDTEVAFRVAYRSFLRTVPRASEIAQMIIAQELQYHLHPIAHPVDFEGHHAVPETGSGSENQYATDSSY